MFPVVSNLWPGMASQDYTRWGVNGLLLTLSRVWWPNLWWPNLWWPNLWWPNLCSNV